MFSGILIGLLLVIALTVGFWFGTLANDKTLASWAPVRPTPTATPEPPPSCYPPRRTGNLEFDSGCIEITVTSPPDLRPEPWEVP